MKYALLLLLACGCSINKLAPPPYAGSIQFTERSTGLKASIPYAGGQLGLFFGWQSGCWFFTPVFTNRLYTAPMSSTFKLGESLNPFDVRIQEQVDTGWSETPPPLRMQFLGTNKPASK